MRAAWLPRATHSSGARRPRFFPAGAPHLDVNAARRHIGADEEAHVTFLEGLHGAAGQGGNRNGGWEGMQGGGRSWLCMQPAMQVCCAGLTGALSGTATEYAFPGVHASMQVQPRQPSFPQQAACVR